MFKLFYRYGLIAFSAFQLITVAVAADDIETPPFEVILSSDTAELRRYSPIITAEVRVVADDIDNAGSMGFMPLANYIFGNNRPGEKLKMTVPITSNPVIERENLMGGDGDKIAMTAPVTTVPDEDGLYAVRFMMPSKWTMETLPAPVDERITLMQLPERYVVVSGFTGPKQEASIDVAMQAINDFVVSNNLLPISEHSLAGYSAPQVPDEQKKWEVHLMVKPAS